MYHMLPYSYRPQANYSRAQHGEFQNLVDGLVNKILGETEIVDAESPNGRKLFNSIDTFFSYGLLTGDGTYWRCIRNFLPRAEQRMLVAECGNANDRFLSIGWLKTSFNKGTLHFMLLALNNQSNKTYLTRYYHVNACIRNSGLLEAITQFIGKLQPIQFAFYSTRQLRAEPAPAAVIDTAPVQISSRAAARQRKLTEKEASNDTVPNIIPTEIPTIISQAIDQDVLLDELVRNRHNRLNTDLYENQTTENGEACVPHTSTEEEKLEDVMTKKMSAANMESMNPDGIEEILANEEPEEEEEIDYNLADGEYQMSQGDVLHLAINVFEKSSEKIIESFTAIENFHSENRRIRYFVMTNYNLYVFKFRVHSENYLPGKVTNLSCHGFFIPMVRMPHDRIKTIKISIDNLSFMLEANEDGFAHYFQNEESDDKTVFSYTAAMAGLESGAHMINSLINVVEHSSRSISVRAEIDDHIGYMCMLQPNLEKQLGRPVDVRSASLCFWYEQPREEREQTTATMSGYLFKSIVNTWIKTTDEAEHKYCVIGGNKSFHIFVDSNCKEEDEELVIDLSAVQLIASGRVTFQLKGAQGNFEFECSTQEECTEWVKTLTSITENKYGPPYITACLAVLTESTIALVQEGEKFWTDGFLRLLNELQGDRLCQTILVYPPKNKANYFFGRSPALCLISNDETIHYLFVRFASELERLAVAIQATFGIQYEKLEDEIMETPLGKTINNVCCCAKDLWPV
ncbi:unnamed protein product [Caenorhabditis sp. 36 PRJEB53466]|nr:unnamed protein product [Caenorhabditis sp. 36 PRJEB53466]